VCQRAVSQLAIMVPAQAITELGHLPDLQCLQIAVQVTPASLDAHFCCSQSAIPAYPVGSISAQTTLVTPAAVIPVTGLPESHVSQESAPVVASLAFVS
jgi:hypothetical protein